MAQSEHGNVRLRLKLHQHIQVAVRAEVVAQNRTAPASGCGCGGRSRPIARAEWRCGAGVPPFVSRRRVIGWSWASPGTILPHCVDLAGLRGPRGLHSLQPPAIWPRAWAARWREAARQWLLAAGVGPGRRPADSGSRFTPNGWWQAQYPLNPCRDATGRADGQTTERERQPLPEAGATEERTLFPVVFRNKA